ncbi:MAG: acyloxyacyl hydrolase [Gammaproteobacteria bacterium]
MVQTTLRSLACAVLLGTATSTFAIDRVAFEYGDSAGDANIDRYGAVATFDWNVRWLQSGSWYLGGYWEAGVNFWDSDPGRTGNDSLVDLHITPVFRWQRDVNAGFAPFLELGVGPHGHTESEIENKDFDIGFAFGSHVGGGIRLGDQGRYEILYRFQHLSNASIGDKNPGVNFHLFQFGYHF